MAEDVIDIAIEKNNLSKTSCVTKELKLYGHDQQSIPPTSIATVDIKRAINDEMCMTPEDFLSRRTRHLLLNAKTAIEAAPLVAKIMAEEMNKNEKWISEQVNDFTKIAKHYIPSQNLKHQTLN